MKKIKLALSLIILLFTISKSYAEWDTFLPVAKIISYKDIYWKYIEEVSQWSAIFINKEWYFVTSSFVVENMERVRADYYTVCLSKDYATKPSCNYTASLIDSDKNLDTAIFKLTSKDTLWKDIDFSKLSSVDIAYNYSIKNQDEISMMWFSFSSWDLFLKKKSKFIWLIKYSDKKYLKTESFITNKFPWWALLNKEWKLIWLYSYFVTNLLDPVNQYSIDINEVKSFIEKNINSNTSSSLNTDNFTKNINIINNLNKSLKINDLFINFWFTNDYEIKSYIQDKWFILKPKFSSDDLVSYLIVTLEKNSNVNTYEELLYYLEDKGLYNAKNYKLWKKQIWSVDFTTVLSNSASYDKRLYSTKIWNNLVTITLERPIFKDWNKEKASTYNAEKLLSSISFNKSTLDNIKFTFNYDNPQVSILSWAYLSDIKSLATNYYWNVHDYFQIWLSELLDENGKGKKFEEIYKNDTLWIENDFKSIIKVLWHKGYIYCKNKNIMKKTEKKQNIAQYKCVINIYELTNSNNNKEYFLNWYLISEKKYLIDNLTKTIKYIESNILIDKIWDWVTRIPNVYKNIVPLKFKDIKYQSDNYKSVIKQLVKYKLISNSLYLKPDEPIKWKDYLQIYFKFKYNYQFNTKYSCSGWKYSCLYQNNYVDINWRKTSLYSIFKDMKIPLDYYVDYEKAKVFNEYIELKLAWINSEYSEEWLKKYTKLKASSIFWDITEKVEAYNNKIYNNENVNIYDVLWISEDEDISYFQTKNVYFMMQTLKVEKKDIYKKWQYEFTSKNKINNNMCTGQYLNTCYKIMTKSLMFDLLIPEMNFVIFDKNLID